jgi:hypothetical protein
MLNDVVNYLTERDDLEKAFAGIKRNLAPAGGLAVFDATPPRCSSAIMAPESRSGWGELGGAGEASPTQ